MIAGLLVAEGFETIEDLALTPIEELSAIEGFDENVAEELRRRAETALARQADEQEQQRVALGVSDDIAALPGLQPKDLVTLGEKGIRSLDDLADLASDELVEILGDDAITEEAANEIIMAARAHWFEAEDGDAT
jgi:N utilization substance protein A